MMGCKNENQSGGGKAAPAQATNESQGGMGAINNRFKSVFGSGSSDSRGSAEGSTGPANNPASSAYSGSGSSYGSSSDSYGSSSGSEIVAGCTSDDPEDGEWCARLRLARMNSQPGHVAVGEIPADPNVGNVFDRPILFEGTQLYIWLSSTTYAIEGYGGGYRNKQVFYFLPTGRFYYKTVMYYGQTTPEGKVSAIWGRYRFTSESGDEVELETDQGERLVLPMRYGRRNLVWDDTTYGQVDWENEALRRQTGR
jgi:hypothetical protein